KQPKDKIRQNTLHGRLLQINAIFESMKKNHLQFTFNSSLNLQDMLSSLEWCIYQTDKKKTKAFLRNKISLFDLFHLKFD
ncbi:unnamed protein product, partial [Rotaria magnacalcarata]